LSEHSTACHDSYVLGPTYDADYLGCRATAQSAHRYEPSRD